MYRGTSVIKLCSRLNSLPWNTGLFLFYPVPSSMTQGNKIVLFFIFLFAAADFELR
jgi:hypothetical protein